MGSWPNHLFQRSIDPRAFLHVARGAVVSYFAPCTPEGDLLGKNIYRPPECAIVGHLCQPRGHPHLIGIYSQALTIDTITLQIISILGAPLGWALSWIYLSVSQQDYVHCKTSPRPTVTIEQWA
jgi:hypothetical protein